MRRMKMAVLAVVMAVTLVVAKGSMVFAAQEIQGSDAKSQAVEVTADVKSMYSVSMPASIELTFSEISKVYIDNVYILGSGGLLGDDCIWMCRENQ